MSEDQGNNSVDRNSAWFTEDVLDHLSRVNDQYIWIADEERGTYWYLSENFDELLGRGRELLLEEPELWFKLIDREDLEYRSSSDETEFPYRHSFELSNLNAEHFVLEEEVLLLLDQDFADRALLGFIDDVTARRERIDELERSTKFQTLGKMSSGIMHEINNPNASLQGNLNYSRRVISRLRENLSGTLDEDDRELLDEVKTALESCSRESERIEHLVDRVELFSKEAQFSQNPDLPSKSTNLGRAEEVLRDLVNELSQQFEVFAEPDLTVESGLSHSSGSSLSVPLSEERVRLVFRHLLQNALDATRDLENPSINVKVRTDDRRLVVNVIDNGRGFEEDLSTLLDPFHTNNAELDRLGLGLSIVESITQRLGGSVNLETHANLGTTASVKVPLEVP